MESNTNMSGQGRPDTLSEGGGTWAVADFWKEIGRLAHAKSIIRTTYPDRRCYRPGVMFTSAACPLGESGWS